MELEKNYILKKENKIEDVKEKYLEIASILEDEIIDGLKKGNILVMKDLDVLNSMLEKIMKITF